MYLFAAQQQTSKLRRPKLRFVYSKLSFELSELTPRFQSTQEKAWKSLKPNSDKKTSIYVFWQLWVTPRVKNLQRYLKRSFFLFSWLMVISNSKKSRIQPFSQVISLLLTLRTCSSVWNLDKNEGYFAVLIFGAAGN